MKYSELFRLLQKDGWYVVRKKGSHVIMKHPEKREDVPRALHLFVKYIGHAQDARASVMPY